MPNNQNNKLPSDLNLENYIIAWAIVIAIFAVAFTLGYFFGNYLFDYYLLFKNK